MATLLSVCQGALEEIGSFNVPDFIVGNTDDTAKQLLAFAKKVGTELTRDYDWQEMIRETTFTTSADVRAYDVASDYDRIVSDTTWDRNSGWRSSGNTTARMWGALRSVQITTGPTYFFRVIRSQITLDRDPPAGIVFAYEYRSKAYCQSSGGTDLTVWTNDTDVTLLPDDLFINGIRYYMLKANNLPYGDAEAEYDAVIASRQEKNTPSGAVNMSAGVQVPGRDDYRLNIPDRVDV
jgi:hypothetical protein